MIQVQIAGQLTADGVAGTRWVLVEPSDAGQPGTPTPAARLAEAEHGAAAAAANAAMPGSLRLLLLKGLVIALGLAAALAMARLEFGPPTVRWWRPPSGPAPVRPSTQPPAAQPAETTTPAPQAPAMPASATALVVKAVLR
jgi:hypothetical protein